VITRFHFPGTKAPLVSSNPSLTFFDKCRKTGQHWPLFSAIRSFFRGRSMRAVLAVFVLLWFTGAPLFASECPGNPVALGTSRVIAVSPTEYPRVGSMQYGQTLHLNDHEVLLTFDDGPLSPYTGRVLDILKTQCVQATFFIIGEMANSYPYLVRRAYDEGHSIGTHTEHHPLRSLSVENMKREIDEGIKSVNHALGIPVEASPFFRFPGLIHPSAVEDYLASKGIMVWSADVVADDWRRMSPAQVVKRALTRLEKAGRGILLLHDMQRRTASALPALLAALKDRQFRIVHAIPAIPHEPQVIARPDTLVSVP
jgi:peptidoglycan-N-acetylglucosamine deacetylase